MLTHIGTRTIEMERLILRRFEYYLNFVAYVGVDRMMLVRLYPEQGGEVRIPQMYGENCISAAISTGYLKKVFIAGDRI